MYSILPAFVSLLFLAYGAYVLGARGASRAAMTFFLVCLTTFAWQFSWAIMFQLSDPAQAMLLAKVGYLLIMFVPTTLYHFTVELTRSRGDTRVLAGSYLACAGLAVTLFAGGAVIDGVRPLFFGFYPHAGPLHPLHLLQTAAVIGRAAWLLYRAQRIAVSTERLRLRYCLASLSIYALAAVDYLVNYGFIFYPPGVLFIAISLGIIAQAMARHNLLANPMLLAATVAHELRTPLATIRNQARVLTKGLPELVACYEQAQRDGSGGRLRPDHLDYLRELGAHIEAEVARSNFITDMVLASANPDALSARGFASHSVAKCVEEALASYPFDKVARSKVVLRKEADFRFHGSDRLMVFVLYNLIKNALHAVDGVAEGRIEIVLCGGGPEGNRLTISDTGHGIPEHVLPHVFDPFYTTKAHKGTGMGLAFCRRVITSFGGTIVCRSREGAFTMMALEFPAG